MNNSTKGKLRTVLASRDGLVLIAFLAIGGYFLWTEHEAHLRTLVPYLPWLLLLACPLLHGFMHGGHGHDHGANETRHKPQDGNEQ